MIDLLLYLLPIGVASALITGIGILALGALGLVPGCKLEWSSLKLPEWRLATPPETLRLPVRNRNFAYRFTLGIQALVTRVFGAKNVLIEMEPETDEPGGGRVVAHETTADLDEGDEQEAARIEDPTPRGTRWIVDEVFTDTGSGRFSIAFYGVEE